MGDRKMENPNRECRGKHKDEQLQEVVTTLRVRGELGRRGGVTPAQQHRPSGKIWNSSGVGQ
jgi:hypothetical protein